jgi:hypothetical protein
MCDRPEHSVVFEESPAMPGWGDITLCGGDMGWHQRSDAQFMADNLEVELTVIAGTAPEYSENRKETP